MLDTLFLRAKPSVSCMQEQVTTGTGDKRCRDAISLVGLPQLGIMSIYSVLYTKGGIEIDYSFLKTLIFQRF